LPPFDHYRIWSSFALCPPPAVIFDLRHVRFTLIYAGQSFEERSMLALIRFRLIVISRRIMIHAISGLLQLPQLRPFSSILCHQSHAGFLTASLYSTEIFFLEITRRIDRVPQPGFSAFSSFISFHIIMIQRRRPSRLRAYVLFAAHPSGFPPFISLADWPLRFFMTFQFHLRQ
jgi:hypothetical protein